MTPELEALARRAVACHGWRWIPGMRWASQTSLGLSFQRILDHEVDDFPPYYGCLPDLTDPATLGCLLALVREAWSDPYRIVRWSGHDWRVVLQDDFLSGWTITHGATEAEALIAALEAAS
jgi:hypothetical protein